MALFFEEREDVDDEEKDEADEDDDDFFLFFEDCPDCWEECDDDCLDDTFSDPMLKGFADELGCLSLVAEAEPAREGWKLAAKLAARRDEDEEDEPPGTV